MKILPSLPRILPSVAAVVFGASLLFADRSAPPPVDGGIRFVDLQRVFDSSEPVKAEMEKLRAALTRSKEDFKAREASLRDQEGELQLLDPTTEQFVERAYELETSQLTLERDKQFVQSSLQARQMKLFLRSYSQVRQAADKVALENGFGAIVIVPPPVDELGGDLQARVETLNSRALLWSSPEYDVTDQIIQALNGL